MQDGLARDFGSGGIRSEGQLKTFWPNLVERKGVGLRFFAVGDRGLESNTNGPPIEGAGGVANTQREGDSRYTMGKCMRAGGARGLGMETTYRLLMRYFLPDGRG